MSRSIFKFLAATVVAALAASACSTARDPESFQSTSQAVASTNPGWKGWGTLGGGLSSDPSAVALDDNHVGVFATQGQVWFNWFQYLQWGGWVNLGNNGNGLTAPPVAVMNGKNIELFVEDSVSGNLLHKTGTYNNGAAPTWSAWESILNYETAGNGVAYTGPLANTGRPPSVVVSQPNNQINVFATFADGTAKVLRGSGFGKWQFWTDLSGGCLFEPGAVSWGPNRLDVFVVGGDSGLYHRYSNDNGATWNPTGTTWEPVGGNGQSSPSVVSWASGRLDLFVSGHPSGQVSGVQHLAWAPGWVWDDTRMLVYQNGNTGQMANPVAVTTGVGAINVFVQSIDQGLQTFAMTGTNPPTWGGNQELSTCFRTGGAPAVVSPDGTALDVLMTGWTPSGSASVYGNSTTAGGADFLVTPGVPPVCSCGGPGGTCCWPDNGCSEGAYCTSGDTCACDSTHVPGTANGQPVCVPAGAANEPCLPGNTCNPGKLVCRSGTCLATGDIGEPCNADNTCNDMSTAACMSFTGGSNLTCVAAGQVGQYCRFFYSPECDDSVCDTTSLKCVPWGGQNEPCKTGGVCNAGALSCQANVCESCGSAVGQSCCAGNAVSFAPGGSTCVSNLTCGAGNKCVAKGACGATGQACCTTGQACITAGTACASGKCEVPPPPDPAGCGEISAPAAPCCHNKPACSNGGVCNQYGDCAPATGSSACGSTAPIPVSICVTTDWGAELYTGEWCSADAATQFYTSWCSGLKSEYGYTTCDVGDPGAACP